MSQAQTKHEQEVDSPPGLCPICQAEVDGLRCPSCGAAVAPGGCRIERLIAQTPHSRVYAARGPDGERMALKEMVFALAPSTQELDAFEREAQILRQLSHPRIPRFLRTFREGEGVQTRLYLAQELIEGQSLADQLETHRFNEVECRQIAREVLEVLGYLHGLSPVVLHRDVKPANLIRRSDGQLFLVDFGAARDLAGSATFSATVVGTFGYMPPEQLGGTLDETCDFYSLGATLAHLLSRKPPAELLGPDMALKLRGNLHVSSAFLAWLERMVQPRRDRRFATAHDALAELGDRADGRFARKLEQKAERIRRKQEDETERVEAPQLSSAVSPRARAESWWETIKSTGGNLFFLLVVLSGVAVGLAGVLVDLVDVSFLKAVVGMGFGLAAAVSIWGWTHLEPSTDGFAAWWSLVPKGSALAPVVLCFATLRPLLDCTKGVGDGPMAPWLHIPWWQVILWSWAAVPAFVVLLFLIRWVRFWGFLHRLPFAVAGWDSLVQGPGVSRDSWRILTIQVSTETGEWSVLQEAISSSLTVFASRANRRFYRAGGSDGRTEWTVVGMHAGGSANSRVIWEVHRWLRGDLSRIASKMGGISQVQLDVSSTHLYVGGDHEGSDASY